MHYFISYIDTKTGKVITRKTDKLTQKYISFANICQGGIDFLYEKAIDILKADVNARYTTYYKKKRSGKFRRIDIPDQNLKEYMRKVNDIFLNNFNFIFPSCVCGYVKHRSIKNAAIKHVGCHTVYKFDLENFFGSCTLDIVIGSLIEIYPFCLLDISKLEAIIKACMIYYDGEYRLPQGAPSSPLISNLTMIPIDYKLSKMPRFSYTRYADDLFFSARYNANTRTEMLIMRKVDKAVCNRNLSINGVKFYARSIYRGNANILGISVGAYNIKIGSKKKQYLKARIWSFLMDAKNGNPWVKKDVERLEGIISHYRQIEPKFIDSIIQKYEMKSSVNYKETVKNILCP